jgi:hypothetical protein
MNIFYSLISESLSQLVVLMVLYVTSKQKSIIYIAIIGQIHWDNQIHFSQIYFSQHV